MRRNASLKKVTVLYCPRVSNEYTDLEINLSMFYLQEPYFTVQWNASKRHCFQNIGEKREQTQWQRNALIYILRVQKSQAT